MTDSGSPRQAVPTTNTLLTNVGFLCEVLLAGVTGILVFLNSMTVAGCASPNECSFPLGEAAIYVALFGVIAVLTASFAVVSIRREARLNTDCVPFLGAGAIVFIYIISTIMTTIAYNSLFGNPLYSA